MKSKTEETYWANTDAICCVLSETRTLEQVYSILRMFLKNKETLSCDYCENPENPDQSFCSEEEMIRYFVERPNLSQTFFWNERFNKRDMVGASFTVDGMIVFSITTSADGQKEEKLLKELANHINSTYFFISYNCYPNFDDGCDFKRISKS